MMKSILIASRKLINDAVGIACSRGKILALFNVPLYSNAIYLMLANFVTSLFGFVFWILAARFYTVDEVGLASAVISVTGLLSMLSGLGMGYGLIRFLPVHRQPHRLINSSFTLTGIIGLIAAVIFVLGLGLWSPELQFLRSEPIYLAVFTIYIPISIISTLSDQAILAGRRAGYILIRSLVFNAVRLALLLVLADFVTSLGIFGAWIGGVVATLFVGLYWLLPRTQPGYHYAFVIDHSAIAGVVRYTFLSYLGDLCWALPGFVLPIVVVNRLGAASNAYFATAWTMSTLLTLMTSAIAASLLAEGSHDEAGLRQHTWSSLKMIFLLVTPVVVLLLVLADKFLLLYGGAYAQYAASLLRWLSVAALPMAVNTVYVNVQRVRKNFKPVILISASITVFVLVLSYLLMPGWGINGVGVAWLVGQGVIAVFSGWRLAHSSSDNEQKKNSNK